MGAIASDWPDEIESGFISGSHGASKAAGSAAAGLLQPESKEQMGRHPAPVIGAGSPVGQRREVVFHGPRRRFEGGLGEGAAYEGGLGLARPLWRAGHAAEGD